MTCPHCGSKVHYIGETSLIWCRECKALVTPIREKKAKK